MNQIFSYLEHSILYSWTLASKLLWLSMTIDSFEESDLPSRFSYIVSVFLTLEKRLVFLLVFLRLPSISSFEVIKPYTQILSILFVNLGAWNIFELTWGGLRSSYSDSTISTWRELRIYGFRLTYLSWKWSVIEVSLPLSPGLSGYVSLWIY